MMQPKKQPKDFDALTMSVDQLATSIKVTRILSILTACEDPVACAYALLVSARCNWERSGKSFNDLQTLFDVIRQQAEAFKAEASSQPAVKPPSTGN